MTYINIIRIIAENVSNESGLTDFEMQFFCNSDIFSNSLIYGEINGNSH